MTNDTLDPITEVALHAHAVAHLQLPPSTLAQHDHEVREAYRNVTRHVYGLARAGLGEVRLRRKDELEAVWQEIQGPDGKPLRLPLSFELYVRALVFTFKLRAEWEALGKAVTDAEFQLTVNEGLRQALERTMNELQVIAHRQRSGEAD